MREVMMGNLTNAALCHCSENNTGACFEQGVLTMPPLTAESYSTMKQSILLVDDEPRLCQSLTVLLEAEGCFQVDAVHSGGEVLSTLEARNYHGVVLDIGLPDIYGHAVAQNIVEQYPDLAVIILTGEDDAKKGMAALRQGVFDYLTKPCDPDHLVRILHRALQQKKSERNLHDANEIINRSPVIAFLWRNEVGWPVEFVSENVHSLCGYTAEEFINGQIHYSDIIHPEDFDRVNEEILHIEQNSPKEYFQHAPYRIRTREGQVKWIEHSTCLKRDNCGRTTHYQGVVLDITVRLKNEKLLRRSKQQWQKTFDAIPALIMIQDRKMRISHVNKAAVDFFQSEYSEIVGNYCYKLFCNRDEACDYCPTLMTLSDARSHTQLIKNERWNRFFQITSSPIVDRAGRVNQIVLSAKDVTKQKQLEEHLFQTQKMEAIATLAGGVAHDFNNLLTVILGSVELIKYGMRSGVDPEENLDHITQTGKRASELVKQLLLFSRESEHKLQSFDPYLIVKEALRMLNSSFPATIEIRTSIDSNSGMIVADPTRIYQVVIELCTNAIHSMEDKKGVLCVDLRRQNLEPEDISEQGVTAGEFVMLSVSDTGSGMTQEILEHVFDPYYTTKEDSSNGRGLGLAALYGTILEYRGMVRVESVLESGTTVDVYIPAVKEEEIPIIEGIEEDIIGSERILVVDDESGIIRVQKAALEKYGYRVTVTTDSLEAWSTIQQNVKKFDLLITDQTMPFLTGVELSKMVLSLRPNLPIILCTGYSARLYEQEALDVGINRFISKPIVGKEFVRVVREVLDQAMP